MYLFDWPCKNDLQILAPQWKFEKGKAITQRATKTHSRPVKAFLLQTLRIVLQDWTGSFWTGDERPTLRTAVAIRDWILRWHCLIFTKTWWSNWLGLPVLTSLQEHGSRWIRRSSNFHITSPTTWDVPSINQGRKRFNAGSIPSKAWNA